MHELDPTQASVLPDTSFTLPQLQGKNILEHFHRIGSSTAEPYLSLANTLASATIPPKPDEFAIQSGWTKYHHLSDGSSFHEAISEPRKENGELEDMLVFDVETLPKYHPYPIMACAVSSSAWYVWISPWLLGETEDPAQLVPFGGGNDTKRIIVGHNVSYDRARIQDEYCLHGTGTRFLDTMALHVASKGMSSHQRPAWMKYRKSKEEVRERREEAMVAVINLLEEIDRQIDAEQDKTRRAELKELRQRVSEGLSDQIQHSTREFDMDVDGDGELASKRWEDITSANSLADVALLHCGIQVSKEIRNDFMCSTREEIRNGIHDYLSYCADDVTITHAVYSKVLPLFLSSCPHPVSFAGILTMGSALLTVNDSWEKYIKQAEDVYKALEDGVKRKLTTLALAAKDLAGPEEKWKEDPWLEQLDWTPKTAGESRGICTKIMPPASTPSQGDPAWYSAFVADPFSKRSMDYIVPALLQLTYDGHPLRYTPDHKWHYIDSNGDVGAISTSSRGSKVLTVLSKTHGLPGIKSGRLSSEVDPDLAFQLAQGDRDEGIESRLLQLALQVRDAANTTDPRYDHFDWSDKSCKVSTSKLKPIKLPKVEWPKWFWDLTKPRKGFEPGSIDVTVRNRIAPILLKLSWHGFPLVHSREHGWTYRVPPNSSHTTRATPLTFYDPVDAKLQEAAQLGSLFYKLPHKDGEKANVGSPLSKTFMKYTEDGTLKSPGEEAKEALEMNSLCSYWISARDRIMNQMVVWQNGGRNLGFASSATEGEDKKWGIILPQVITMGTVTRRAIEKTWLTASNAKKNRVGSELKSLVQAPEGYSLVGADVDSEELWISSCMGDAQFGMHGATAIGWMTLEGTKAAGTDLHSKTAKILGISRDQAKVFNYSRIYGAGMRHAILLLLQANPGMISEQAQKLAENLYASTKGKNTYRTDIFGRKFWFGGTESYVFNKLEHIALSDRPMTPALGCGVTGALSKEYLPSGFGSDYMPSRINWVVQSSGVDYLHLLIVSMEHLCHKYAINARYLISVHDEVRYLVKDEDRYRAALALQIANLWTRCMFAYKLGMDDLPQGVAFFSAVDIDHVLRKEVDMPCVTPSQPTPIPSGESLDITKVLAKTSGGSLWADGRTMETELETFTPLKGFHEPNCLEHRAENAYFLRAQATQDFEEIKHLAQQLVGSRFEGQVGKMNKGKSKKRKVSLGNGEGFDWTDTIEKLLKDGGTFQPHY